MIESLLAIALIFSVVGNVIVIISVQKKNIELMDRIMSRNATEAAVAGKIRDGIDKKNKLKELPGEEPLKTGEVEA